MSEAGYQKMCEVLRTYLNKFEYQDLNTKKLTKKDSLTLSFNFELRFSFEPLLLQGLDKLIGLSFLLIV